MKMAEHLATKSSDPLWLAGCYTVPYVVSTMVAITNRWTRKAVLADEGKLKGWVNEHWEHLPIRKERRVNGMGPDKLADVMVGYASWLEEGNLERLHGLPFEEAFGGLNPPHYGRYFKMKLYEVLRRTLRRTKSRTVIPEMPDILPKDGAHPRKGLALMFHEHDYKSNKVEDLGQANELSGELKQDLEEAGITVDWFVTEVLLCNYRQAVNGGQYPGRAHDSELGHYHVVQRGFPEVGKVLKCRADLFDGRYLGEVGDRWQGRRVEIGKVLMEYGYVWSDALYDYNATTDLARPVRCT